MHIHCSLRMGASILLTLAALTAAASAAPAPADGVPLNENEYPNYIRQRLQVIAAAQSLEKVLSARSELIGPFRELMINTDALSRRKAQEYASAFAKTALPLIGTLKGDVAQFNVAIVASSLHDPAIRPVLEALVKHSNAGVRYLGWQGYANVWPRILSLGPATTQELLGVLSSRMKDETNALVVSKMMNVATFPTPQAPVNVPDQELKAARAEALRIIGQRWNTLLAGLMSGDRHATQSVYTFASSFPHLIGAVESNKEARTAALQMLADMMAATARAYSALEGKGQTARHYLLILVEAENALRQVLRAGEGRVRQLAGSIKAASQPEAIVPDVGLAVFDWIDVLKKNHGVVEPKVPEVARIDAPAAPPAE